MTNTYRARFRYGHTWTVGRLTVTATRRKRRGRNPARTVRLSLSLNGTAIELRSSDALRLVDTIVDQLEALDREHLDN